MNKLLICLLCIPIFSNLGYTPCYCEDVTRAGLVGKPNSIERVKGIIDSLKRYYEFGEWSLIIRDIREIGVNNRDRMLLLADWAYFQMDYPLADSLYTNLLARNPKDVAALK